MKEIIRITEADLHEMINESLNQYLEEGIWGGMKGAFKGAKSAIKDKINHMRNNREDGDYHEVSDGWRGDDKPSFISRVAKGYDAGSANSDITQAIKTLRKYLPQSNIAWEVIRQLETLNYNTKDDYDAYSDQNFKQRSQDAIDQSNQQFDDAFDKADKYDDIENKYYGALWDKDALEIDKKTLENEKAALAREIKDLQTRKDEGEEISRSEIAKLNAEIEEYKKKVADFEAKKKKAPSKTKKNTTPKPNAETEVAAEQLPEKPKDTRRKKAEEPATSATKKTPKKPAAPKAAKAAPNKAEAEPKGKAQPQYVEGSLGL